VSVRIRSVCSSISMALGAFFLAGAICVVPGTLYATCLGPTACNADCMVSMVTKTCKGGCQTSTFCTTCTCKGTAGDPTDCGCR